MIPDRVLLPLIVACALFMENLDATILVTALPAIAEDLGESPITLKLALTSYLIAVAIFIPAAGWAADRFGTRTVFRIAVVVFAASSLFCGISDSVAELVIGRIGQGLGGAMMVPVGRMVILRSVPKSELVVALSWLTIPALLGPVVGPLLGGFITTYFDWRWIFWINLPISVLGYLLASFLPEIRVTERRSFDGIGFVLIGVGLAGVVAGSTMLGLAIVPAFWSLAALLGGAALIVLYVLRARRVDRPILDLALFRIPTFRISVLGGAPFWMGVGALPFLLPLLLQLGFGATPLHSGIVTFASAVGAIAMKFIAPPVLRRFGFRMVLIGSGLAAAAFAAAPVGFTAKTPLAVLVGVLLAGGFVRSLQYTGLNSLAFAAVPQERMGGAITLSSVAQLMAMSAGITVAATLLTITGGQEAAFLPSSFVPAFLTMGALGAAATFAYARLPQDAGADMSGHRRAVNG